MHLLKRTRIPSKARYNVWRTKASQPVLSDPRYSHTHVVNIARHTGLDKNAQARLTQLKADLERIEKAKKVLEWMKGGIRISLLTCCFIVVVSGTSVVRVRDNHCNCEIRLTEMCSFIGHKQHSLKDSVNNRSVNSVKTERWCMIQRPIAL